MTSGSPAFVQDTGFNDPTGSSTGHLNLSVTRAATDTYPGDQPAAFVVEYVVDYTKPVTSGADEHILSIQPIDPGQKVSVTETYAQKFEYPNGYSSPRVTVIDQKTYTVIASFSRDPFTSDVTPPTAPTITSNFGTDTTVQLIVSGGTDNVGIVGWTLFRDGSHLANLSNDGTGVDYYTDTGLTPGSTYHYTAQASDAENNLSPLSVPLVVVAGIPVDSTPPTAPAITTTDRTTTTVDLVVSGGTDNVGIVAYKIFRDGAFITTVNPGDPYTDTGLTSK